MKVQLWVDLDGVLADFHTGYQNLFGPIADKSDSVSWKLVQRHTGFYQNLPPMPDMMELWDYVAKYDPFILTGVPYFEEAKTDKRIWVDNNLGKHVPVFTCKSKEKCLYASPGDILIDDWSKYQHKWLANGGVWITHCSAKQSIQSLQQLGY